MTLSKVAATLIDRVEVVVAAADMDEIRQDLEPSGDTYTGVLRVPAGPDRAFTMNGYDQSGVLTYSGSATVDVVANERVRVEVTMQRVAVGVGDVEITGTVLLNQ